MGYSKEQFILRGCDMETWYEEQMRWSREIDKELDEAIKRQNLKQLYMNIEDQDLDEYFKRGVKKGEEDEQN